MPFFSARANQQLARIKNGRSPVAAKLLADGFSIVAVLFGSPEVAARLDLKPEDSPLTIGDLFDGFLPHLKTTVGFDQHTNSESWIKKVRGFFKDDRRVMTLNKEDLESYRKQRAEVDGVGPTSINKELGSLKAAIKWGITTKKLTSDPIDKWPSLKTTRQKKFEWKSDIEAMVADQSFKDDSERRAFLKEMSLRMVLTAEEMKKLVKLARDEMPELELPLMVVCSSGIRRKELVLTEKQDFDPKRGTIIVGSKKQSKKDDMTFRTIVLPTEVAKALREHHKSLPKSEKMLFPIFGKIDKTYGYRWVEYQMNAKGEFKLDGQGRKIVKKDTRETILRLEASDWRVGRLGQGDEAEQVWNISKVRIINRQPLADIANADDAKDVTPHWRHEVLTAEEHTPCQRTKAERPVRPNPHAVVEPMWMWAV